jgi:NAD+ kinase
MEAGERENLRKEMKRFKKAHDEHYNTMDRVESILKAYGVKYTKCFRGKKINYAPYDLVITVGGDGTFLEACRNIKGQIILGVNSAPSFSVGKLCTANIRNFEAIIRHIVGGKYAVSVWPRLRLNLQGHVRPLDCVNDVLICHLNPAAMSRYYLKIGRMKEEQRSSGVWIATPAGSTGAIRSAGGKVMKVSAHQMQYAPRELYYGFSKMYRHKGGLLSRGESITVTSLMRSGMIFVDGTHFEMKFPFNSTLKVTLSPAVLNTISSPGARKWRAQ